ncbi:MAG TPA: major capsid protein [Candidatus Saccharimonadales bacterium]|nr:major capsid protein [Candidatus Saccharimonadales bacterium]
MDTQATKAEINSLNEFQKNLHFPSYDNEPLLSKFHRAYIKTTWYCSTLLPLKSTDEGEDVIYAINPTFHYLMYTYLRFVLPPIKVKAEFIDKIKICWCHNVGTNIIKNASFKEDDRDYQSFDSIWTDDYFQYFMLPGAGKRRNHRIGIGNIDILEDWTTVLPYYPINVDQPWYYGEDTASAFPILYRNSQNRAEHRYTFRRKIADLLRMQILDNKTNQWVSVNPAKHMTKLDYGRYITVQKPTLWGQYAYITDKEIETHKCSAKPKEIYIKDVEICDSENENSFGTKSVITLHCKNPCLAIFWKAQNMDAEELNNHSNYTSNSEDLYRGWDPISKMTLRYGTTNKLNNMDSDHFNIGESRKHFPSSPNEAGYHAYSFAWNSSNYHGEPGVVLCNLNASLICNISDNDIYNMSYQSDIHLNSDVENESLDHDLLRLIEPKVKTKGPKFITRVRLLVLKKLTIQKDDDNKNFKFTLL